MAEIKNNDVQEIKNPSVEGFNQIVPEKGTTVQDARDYWDNTYRNCEGQESAISAEKDISSKESDLKKEQKDEVRYIHTINEQLEGEQHSETGVEFKRKGIDLPNGEKIEGVFPEFDSLFNAKIPEELFLKRDKAQFKECNKQLAEAIDRTPELKSKFSDEQIEQIRDGMIDGTAPDGYVWHHDAEAGKLQLVDFKIHDATKHTGGRAVWGGGGKYR